MKRRSNWWNPDCFKGNESIDAGLNNWPLNNLPVDSHCVAAVPPSQAQPGRHVVLCIGHNLAPIFGRERPIRVLSPCFVIQLN